MFKFIFSAIILSLSSLVVHAQDISSVDNFLVAQKSFQATMIISNNTNATLEILVEHKFSEESASATLQPFTEQRVQVPAGFVSFLAIARLSSPPVDYREEFTVSTDVTYTYNITAERFGRSLVSDRPTDETPCEWIVWGTGDIAFHDVGQSNGSEPPPNMCTASNIGQGAVCWPAGSPDNGGPWCTYKDLPAYEIEGGADPGTIYGCSC